MAMRYLLSFIYILPSDLTRRLPSLEVLDQEAITQISFDAPQASTSTIPVEKPSATTFPFDMGGSFVTGVSSDVIGAFLVR